MKNVLPLVLFAAVMGYGQRPAPGVDISGYWTPALNEDAQERGPGPELTDYSGFPLNEAGRLWALSYNVSRVTLRHHQCDGYVTGYQGRAVGNARSWEERDPHTHRLVAIHWYNQTTEGHQVIWMDGRPHPPAYAPHSWMGFSTGRYVGNKLEVFTTHIKQGWLRRNGSPQSDQATVRQFFMRHGDHLTYTTIITDPVFLAEPLVRTTDYYRLPVDPGAWLYACEDGEQILDRAPDNVPNYLPGQHPFLMEFSEKHKVPLLGALGGPETMYPEIVAKLRTATVAEGLARTSPSAGPPQVSLAVDPTPRDGEIHVLPLRKNISMLLGDGANIVVQTGDEGPLVIDTGAGQLSEKVIAAIRNLSPRPIQFIVNTSYRGDHTGGNVKLRAVGLDPSVQGSFFSRQFADAGVGATIMSHQNTANHLVATIAADGVPSDTFLEARRRTYHNEDELELFWLPNAVTDGDSIVHFRLADVIVAGDIFNTTQYPFIDLANGGSLQGEIEALNAILDRTIYRHEGEGGTLIVPGHGYLSEEHEVVEYRDMLVIVRDRVRDLIKKGSTLDQVKAARVTADYDTRYGANSGDWTTDKFVAMVYNSLKNPRVKK